MMITSIETEENNLKFMSQESSNSNRILLEPLRPTGGISFVDLNNKTIRSFREYAESELKKRLNIPVWKLTTILGFYQIVAGANYSFFILVRFSEDYTKLFNVVVNNSLVNNRSIWICNEMDEENFGLVDEYNINTLYDFVIASYKKRKINAIGINCSHLTKGEIYRSGLFILEVYISDTKKETVSVYDKDGVYVLTGFV